MMKTIDRKSILKGFKNISIKKTIDRKSILKGFKNISINFTE